MIANQTRGNKNATTRKANVRYIARRRLAPGDLLSRSRHSRARSPIREILAQTVGGGTAGDRLRWAEGPVYFGDGRYFLWSDIPNNRIVKWDEETGAVSIFRKPSNFANGNTRDRQGRLVTCEHGGAASPAPNMTARSRC